MGGFGGKPRANHKGGPGGVFIKKRKEGFEQKREVFLVGFPATDSDNLILFLDGGVELKDIGLNRVRNAVDLLRVDPEADSEKFPEIGGVRGFNRYRGQEF